MDMNITFPGNKRVHAEYNGFVIETDQSADSGGDNSAPQPFDLFLASLGTCAGIYVLSFLQQRGLPTEGAGLVMTTVDNPETKLISKVLLDIKVPEGFPEKYRNAVIRAAEQCAVKRHLDSPPIIETTVSLG